jgi:hypothetical protein
MAIWEAKIIAVQNGPFINVRVNASSANTAKATINAIYNNPPMITNLRCVSSRDSGGNYTSSSDPDDMTIKYWILGIGTVLYFAVTYWFIAIPLGILAFILWFKWNSL